jgi:hypothetical protein
MAEPVIHYIAKGQLIDLPDGKKDLVVNITIICEACGGQIDMQLPGHHLRAVRDTLVDMVDRYPEYCNLNDTIERRILPPLHKES